MVTLTRSQEETIETAAIDAYIANSAYEEAFVGHPMRHAHWDDLQAQEKERWRTVAKTVLLSAQGPIYRHQVRDELVEVLGTAEAQVSTGPLLSGDGKRRGRTLHEGDEVVTYRAPGGKLYVRFPDEFSDGRFAPVVG